MTEAHLSLSRLQAFYDGLGAEALLRVMVRLEFPGSVAVLSSFGADSALLLAMVAEVDPATPILFLDTGKHFPETLDYVETLRTRLGLQNIVPLTPREDLLARTDPAGELWQHQPNRCCWIRKVEPLQRVLKEGRYQALITGRKRYQTPDREGMETIELGDDGIFRVNPLAGFSAADIAEAMQTRNLPPHPLLAQGYRSIGCAPCTAPVGEADDPRAGRWQHTTAYPDTKKSECGIHVPAAAEAVQGWEI
jgi:phosphoadenosine phosphosulfate reductase